MVRIGGRISKVYYFRLVKYNSASNGHRLTKIEGTIFRNTHKLTYLGLLRIDMVRSSVSPPLGAINSMTGLDRIHGNIHGNCENLRWELTDLIDYMRSDLWRLRHTYDRSSCRLAVRLSPLGLHLPVGPCQLLLDLRRVLYRLCGRLGVR